jgi:porphobilinogen synthase
MHPRTRLRRLRRTPAIRSLFDAPLPGPEKLIWPAFVLDGPDDAFEPIASMPGQARLGLGRLLATLEPIAASGIGAVLLFGLPPSDRKNAAGTEAFNPDGIVQRAVRAVKKRFPDLVVVTDVCVCAYTNHGHCGPLGADGAPDNDAACEVLAASPAPTPKPAPTSSHPAR